MLTESQLVALEQAKLDKEAHGEFESEHPGYCLAQDTFYVGMCIPMNSAIDSDRNQPPVPSEAS